MKVVNFTRGDWRISDGNVSTNDIGIKQFVLTTMSQRIWGAWQVLAGKAGIIFIAIKHKDFYHDKNSD